jgi:hypothetical protein
MTRRYYFCFLGIKLVRNISGQNKNNSNQRMTLPLTARGVPFEKCLIGSRKNVWKIWLRKIGGDTVLRFLEVVGSIPAF